MNFNALFQWHHVWSDLLSSSHWCLSRATTGVVHYINHEHKLLTTNFGHQNVYKYVYFLLFILTFETHIFYFS